MIPACIYIHRLRSTGAVHSRYIIHTPDEIYLPEIRETKTLEIDDKDRDRKTIEIIRRDAAQPHVVSSCRCPLSGAKKQTNVKQTWRRYRSSRYSLREQNNNVNIDLRIFTHYEFVFFFLSQKQWKSLIKYIRADTHSTPALRRSTVDGLKKLRSSTVSRY